MSNKQETPPPFEPQNERGRVIYEQVQQLQTLLSEYWGQDANIAMGHILTPESWYFDVIAGTKGLSITIGALFQPDPQTMGPILDSGKVKGKEWQAGLGPQDKRPWIQYGGLDLGPFITPKRLPNILRKLGYTGEASPTERPQDEAQQNEQAGGTMWANRYGFNALAISATADLGEQAEGHVKRRQRGELNLLKNPLMQHSLTGKGTEVRIYFGPEAHKLDKSPKTVEEVRAFLASVVGPEAYAVLLGLAYFCHISGKDELPQLNLSELQGKLYGRKSKAKKFQLVETILDLENTVIELEQPEGKRGLRTYRFRPLQLHEKFAEGGIPSTIGITLFPSMEGGPKFKAVAIPEGLFKLRERDLALACYLLLQGNHYRIQSQIKAPLAEVMQAAGLGNLYKNPNHKRQALHKLKGKLERLERAGIIGRYEGEQNGYALFSPVFKPSVATKTQKGINTPKKG